jgi:prepilin-type N-terminal cleavage/methylation domain-containing protein
MNAATRSRRGFTLMELLVVLLIIGILSTVAIRTIDATRDRSLFDRTAVEMKELVAAIAGNEDAMVDGRRSDFGFYGDMGRLPKTLRELVENTESDTNWHGPYLRRPFLGDSTNFLYDAWGNPYTYDDEQGTIATIGGKYPMTMRVVDSMPQLTDNAIYGQVMDREGNPPGEQAAIQVVLYTRSGRTYPVLAGRGGDYEISTMLGDTVPAGTHRLVAYDGVTDSVVRWVTVAPRSRNVVDFRFSRSFQSLLRVVGAPRIPPGVPDSSGFEFDVVSEYQDEVVLDSFQVVQVSSPVYFRTLMVDGQVHPGYPRLSGELIGPGQPTAPLAPGVAIDGRMAQRVTFGLLEFSSNPAGSDTVNIHGVTFRLLFSDGSVVSVSP